MSIHQSDPERKPDSLFCPGKLAYLVPGNKGRLLDGRRTPGYVEKVWPERAMFRWHITKFEDAGSYWDLPAEYVERFQFEPAAVEMEERELKEIKEKVRYFSRPLIRDIDPVRREKEQKEISTRQKKTEKWLKNNSGFFSRENQLNLSARKGPQALARDLKKFMQEKGFAEAEEKTAENMVLNPFSGEWIKGMSIVAAEMGLTRFRGKIPRTSDIFSGMGNKEFREDYLRERNGFIRAFFSLTGRGEVPLYRGMATEGDWMRKDRSFLSCTFNLEVGKSFCGMQKEENYRQFYLVKLTVPVGKIFMSYLETEAMNRQYLEAEAQIFYDYSIEI